MKGLRFDSADLLLIRWQIVLFVTCCALATGIYFTVGYMGAQASQELQRANSAFQQARSSVELIEDEEATIIENIDEYRDLMARGILEPEDLGPCRGGA
jgi:FAD synthase